MQRVLWRTLGIVTVLGAAAVGAVHMADSTSVATAGGGNEPCMVYAQDKTDHSTSSVEEPNCPPPNCDNSIGYTDDQGVTKTWKPDHCQPESTPKPTHPPTYPTNPPSTPCASAWVDSEGAHAYDNCGTTPRTPPATGGSSTSTTAGGGGSSTSTTSGGGSPTSTSTTAGGGSTSSSSSTVVAPPPPPVGPTTSTSTTVKSPIPPINGPATIVPTPTLAFAFLGPVCVGDHPYIGWDITLHDVTSGANTATITIRDTSGNIVKQLFNQPLQGQTLWPGATIDPDDWPGWKLVDGVWVEDPTDAVLRDGVSVTAEVNPTGTGFVTYPPATSACASPKNGTPVQQPSTPTAPPGGLPVTE